MQKSCVIEYVCMQTKCEIKYIPTLFLTGKTIFQFDYFFCPLQLLAHPVQDPIFLQNWLPHLTQSWVLRQGETIMPQRTVWCVWDVTEPLYIEILRSNGPQKILADVDLTHLKSYWVIHTISIAVLGHSKSLWVIYFVSSHPKSSWVIKTSYVRGPPIQNPIYCDSVVTTTTVCGGWLKGCSVGLIPTYSTGLIYFVQWL